MKQPLGKISIVEIEALSTKAVFEAKLDQNCSIYSYKRAAPIIAVAMILVRYIALRLSLRQERQTL